jgi:UTP--glucose-1-phosphate uridylyltransferase
MAAPGSLRTTSAEDFNLAAAAGSESMRKALDDISATISDATERPRWRQKEGNGFQKIYDQFLRTRADTVRWDAIRPPDAETIIPMSKLGGGLTPDQCRKIASKLCVLKLNGGLGTTMGCVGPKSTIEVTSHQTFLDLVVRQIQHLNKTLGVDVPLVLMNSFNTHDDTIKIIEKYQHQGVSIITFNQSRYPRIFQDSLLPEARDIKGGDESWYPPGHGDVYPALVDSGVLDKLLEMGKEYVFLANIDNLAATVNFEILDYMMEHGNEFIMEVTDKTRADIKGGTLIKYHGKSKLLEIAQVPKEHVSEFKSIKKFKIFNTNNLWISLKAIKRIVTDDSLKAIDIIQNPKAVKGVRYLQLETAAGAAIQFFEKAIGINVPRSRFLPVKSTSDLLAVQSDLYKLDHGTLVMNPERVFPSVPVVKLGDKYKYVSDYQKRLGGRINIIELDHLTISGDVYLGPNVTLKGTVIIVANEGERIDIPPGSILEDKVVTGNLRILDH